MIALAVSLYATESSVSHRWSVIERAALPHRCGHVVHGRPSQSAGSLLDAASPRIAGRLGKE